MKQKEALKLASEALRKQRKIYAFDYHSFKVWGSTPNNYIERAASKYKLLTEAIEYIEGIGKQERLF